MKNQNFEPGNKAIIVKSFSGNEGKIIELIQMVGIAPIITPAAAYEDLNAGEEVWLVRSFGTPLKTQLLNPNGTVSTTNYGVVAELMMAKSKLRLLPSICEDETVERHEEYKL